MQCKDLFKEMQYKSISAEKKIQSSNDPFSSFFPSEFWMIIWIKRGYYNSIYKKHTYIKNVHVMMTVYLLPPPKKIFMSRFSVKM